MSQKLWGGRFTGNTHHLVESYTASISFDQELALEDILGSLAHAKMLKQCQIISAAEHAQLQQGLGDIATAINNHAVQFRIEDEDIHMNIERMLSERVGAVAGKLHTARSRNDQVALDLHLYLRKKMLGIIELLTELQNTLLTLAAQHEKTIIPGYTHLQRAQPLYLSQHLLAYVAMLQRDSERLIQCWQRVNQSPLGACALAGTSFPTNRQFVADQLGFDGIYLNTLDAVSDRDFAVEFISAASLIMMHLSRLSEELILWASQEFNFVNFADAFSTGSSIMPQKKNPDVTELSRGKTGRVYGALFNLLTLMKGLPLAYNKDMQEDKEPIFDVIKTLSQTLEIFSPMLSTLKFNTEKMHAAAQEGYLNATILAEYLVKKGLAFRAAHEVVGKMVAHSIAHSCRLEEISLIQMQEFSTLIEEDIYQILAVEYAVAACDKSVNNVGLFQQQLSTSLQWLESKKNLLAEIYNRFFGTA